MLANGPFFEIAGICQPLWRGSQRPAADACGELDRTEGGRDPVELAPRLEGHPPRSDCTRWVNDDILKVLVDSYDIKLVSTPDAAIPKMLA